MTKKTQADESGFTLVELLTVMMIISVLAAIALPVFYSQRAKGYRAQMAADLHTAITAETAYSTNNDGLYTTDTTALANEGFRGTGTVVTHFKVVGSGFVTCTKAPTITGWLTYSSATGVTTTASSDCA